MMHELKIWPPFYEQIVSGEKSFELRKNDRNFQPGDTLLLKEFIPKSKNEVFKEFAGGTFTGRQQEVGIKYVFSDVRFGLLAGFCILGLQVFSEIKENKPTTAYKPSHY